MPNTSTPTGPRRLKKGLPHPIRFDETEQGLISDLQDRTEPTMSVNDVIRRAIRFAVPKFISGKARLTELKPKASSTAPNGS